MEPATSLHLSRLNNPPFPLSLSLKTPAPLPQVPFFFPVILSLFLSLYSSVLSSIEEVRAQERAQKRL